MRNQVAIQEKTGARILICSSDKGSSYSLRHFLLRNRFSNLVFKPVEERLRQLIHTPHPDIIITTDQVWKQGDGIRQIEKLRYSERTPIIIWADRISDSLLSAITALQNVYFIQKSDDENVLIKTLSWMHREMKYSD